MYKALHLQHHKHTGKLLHHKHTSYRALAVVFVLAGALLGYVQYSLRQIAHADSYIVTATVPAPIPTTPAVILQPTDGSITHNPNIIVSGTCPVESPAVSVVIYDNGNLLGSVPCAVDGTFSIQVTLSEGANQLLARTLTITGDYGPDGTPVTVTYKPTGPSPPPNSGGSSKPGHGQPSTSCSSAGPLAIHSNSPYLVFGPSKPAEWVGSFSGGCSPYTVTIDWGDGVVTHIKNVGTDVQHFDHPYSNMRPYAIRITAEDTAGTKTEASFAALTPYVPSGIGSIFGGGNNITGSGAGGISPKVLITVYGGYISLLAVFGAIWLHATQASFAHIPTSSRGTAHRVAKKRIRK